MMMKARFHFLLVLSSGILVSCVQQGLVQTDFSAVSSSSANSDSSGNSSSALSPKTRVTFPAINDPEGDYLLTSFGRSADRAAGFFPVSFNAAFGANDTAINSDGRDFCFSNEQRDPTAGDIDSLVKCARPSNFSFTNLKTLAGINEGRQVPAVIHSIKLGFLDFQNSSSSSKDSVVSIQGLVIKTAPLKTLQSDGILRWDPNNIKTFDYKNPGSGGTSCSLSQENAVGFEIPEDLNDREKFFLTGLWLFERSRSKFIENDSTMTTDFVDYRQTYNIGGQNVAGLRNLFADYLSVRSSYIVPVDNAGVTEPGFLKFNSGTSEIDILGAANPQTTTVGLYRNTNTLVPSGVTIKMTYDMGRNVEPANGSSSASSIANFANSDNSVVVGLCIKGQRFIHTTTSSSSSSIQSDPLVQALKVELRSIKLRMQ